jgi:hypothetical protein
MKRLINFIKDYCVAVFLTSTVTLLITLISRNIMGTPGCDTPQANVILFMIILGGELISYVVFTAWTLRRETSKRAQSIKDYGVAVFLTSTVTLLIALIVQDIIRTPQYDNQQMNVILFITILGVGLIAYVVFTAWTLRETSKRTHSNETKFTINLGDREFNVDVKDVELLQKQLEEIEQRSRSSSSPAPR